MFAVIVLAINAVFFVVASLAALARPAQFAMLLGLALPGADGINEVRAQYGGVFLIFGLLLVAALFGGVPRVLGLTTLCLLFGGLIAGRLIALIAGGNFAGYGWTIRALFLIDSSGFLLSAAALASEMSIS